MSQSLNAHVDEDIELRGEIHKEVGVRWQMMRPYEQAVVMDEGVQSS